MPKYTKLSCIVRCFLLSRQKELPDIAVLNCYEAKFALTGEFEAAITAAEAIIAEIEKSTN